MYPFNCKVAKNIVYEANLAIYIILTTLYAERRLIMSKDNGTKMNMRQYRYLARSAKREGYNDPNYEEKHSIKQDDYSLAYTKGLKKIVFLIMFLFGLTLTILGFAYDIPKEYNVSPIVCALIGLLLFLLNTNIKVNLIKWNENRKRGNQIYKDMFGDD